MFLDNDNDSDKRYLGVELLFTCEIFPDRMGPRTCDLYLVHQSEPDPVLIEGHLSDLLHGAGLLSTELVTWKC